ncbi:MAG: hypothetical protein O3A14_05495, partial [Cyanobacteria bacterium]|nr:hypothetical protein [Cyanobacteriota bacterium]
GTFIRDRIADEVARELDQLGQSMVVSLRQTLLQRFGQALDSDHPTAATPALTSDTWERVTRIVEILRQTQGVDLAMVARIAPPLLFKAETRDMGQRIAGNLTQRALARLLRDLLLSEQPTQESQASQDSDLPKILPAAR